MIIKPRQHDEMEQDIANRSIVDSYRFIELTMVIWIIISIITHRQVIIPIYILLSGTLVRFISAIIYKKQVGDDRWKHALIALVAAVSAIFFLMCISPVSI